MNKETRQYSTNWAIFGVEIFHGFTKKCAWSCFIDLAIIMLIGILFQRNEQRNG